MALANAVVRLQASISRLEQRHIVLPAELVAGGKMTATEVNDMISVATGSFHTSSGAVPGPICGHGEADLATESDSADAYRCSACGRNIRA